MSASPKTNTQIKADSSLRYYLQVTFTISAVLLCLPFFAVALRNGAMSNPQNGLLFASTFTTFIWFMTRYVYLIVLKLSEGYSSAVVNCVTTVVGLWAIQLYDQPQAWFLALSFLMFMAMWKDLEVVLHWRRANHMWHEVRYHQDAFLKDLLSAIVLLFVHLAHRGHVIQPNRETLCTMVVAGTWLAWTVLSAVVKAHAIAVAVSKRGQSISRRRRNEGVMKRSVS